MNTYTATLEVVAKIRDDDHVDELMDQLQPFHGSVGVSPRGYPFGVITMAIACDVLTTDEFDRRVDWVEVPPLVSISEAAEILGVSRQRIQERIHDSSLQGIKVGNSWVLVKSTLSNRPPGRPRKRV